MNPKIDFSLRGLLFTLVFWIAPVFDTFGAILQPYIPGSLLMRALILGLGLIQIHRSKALPDSAKIDLYAALLGFILLTVIHIPYEWEAAAAILDIGAVLKLIYFPVTLTLLLDFKLSRLSTRHAAERAILFTGLLALVSLISGTVSGWGGTIGGRGENMEGNKGFMIGANEVGLILLVTSPILIKELTRKIKSSSLAHLGVLGALSLGAVIVLTKSAFSAPFFVLASHLRNIYTALTMRSRFAMAAILIFSSFAGAMHTEENNLNDAWRAISSLDTKDLAPLLLRGRENYLAEMSPRLINADLAPLYFWLGAGELTVRDSSAKGLLRPQSEGGMYEMDPLDLIATFGISGFALYLYSLFRCIRAIRIARLPPTYGLLLIMVALHSILAGHVIFSPQITTLLAFTLFCLPARDPIPMLGKK